MTIGPELSTPVVPETARATALAHGLPLVWLAAFAAVIDLGWNRVAVLAMGGTHDDAALWLLRTGPFWRNLAAVSGLVALVVGIASFLRMAGFAAPLRRIQVASLAGLLLPGLVLATLVAKERLPSVIVLLAVGVGNALVVILGITAGGYFKSPYRAGVWGGALASILVLVLLVAASLESLQLWLSDGSDVWGKIAWGMMIACRVGGELTWLGAPLVVARWLAPELRTGSARALAVAVATAILGIAVAGEASNHTDFSVIAYGAFRVTLLSERLVGLYALPLGAVLGVGFAVLATGSPSGRQVGAYLVLWVAAGFAPRTPIQILYVVLAVVSIARAVQASDPEGRRRASLGWGDPSPAPGPGAVPLAPQEEPAGAEPLGEPPADGGEIAAEAAAEVEVAREPTPRDADSVRHESEALRPSAPPPTA